MSEERASSARLTGEAISGLRPKRTALQNVGSFIRRKPLGTLGALVAIILVVVAIFAPQIATHDPFEIDVERQFAAPSTDALLGGDALGRDVFSRLVYGARISLYVGLVSAFVGSTVGLLVGVASVHFGGTVDLIVQRVIDGLMAIPALILALALVAGLGPSVRNVIIALSIAFIPAAARLIRSQALAIKEMDYVLAARAVGAGHVRIILRHMAPNVFGLYIVLVTLTLGGAIIAEASLTFLGVGSPPNEPTWGGMLTGAAQQYIRVAPWVAVFPGVAIGVVVFAWNLLGDALRDVLDPRLRGTS